MTFYTIRLMYNDRHPTADKEANQFCCGVTPLAERVRF